MTKIDSTICKRCGRKSKIRQPVLLHLSRYTEKAVKGHDGVSYSESLYMVDRTAHLCNQCTEELLSFIGDTNEHL